MANSQFRVRRNQPKVFSSVQSNTDPGLRSIFKCTLNWNSFFSWTVSWYILDAREVRAQYENAGPLLEKGSARSKADGDHSHIKRTVVEMTGKASSIHEVSHLYEKNQYPRALRSVFFLLLRKKARRNSLFLFPIARWQIDLRRTWMEI